MLLCLYSFRASWWCHFDLPLASTLIVFVHEYINIIDFQNAPSMYNLRIFVLQTRELCRCSIIWSLCHFRNDITPSCHHAHHHINYLWRQSVWCSFHHNTVSTFLYCLALLLYCIVGIIVLSALFTMCLLDLGALQSIIHSILIDFSLLLVILFTSQAAC